jgi:RNA polymerase-binding transcription factor DksA
MMPDDTQEIRSRLEARLGALRERLTEIHEILREPEDDDLSEQAIELDDDEVLERLSRAGRDEVLLIRAALERIDDKSYGKCVSCGKAIEKRRLRALPEASTCLPCARKSSE